ncbi:MAG: SurA N-terminal domain-containing protein [Muribaculaceae bacterium]|nr:SurA N-terminal domain-containing protein [Muribaculaceae bacterium]
MATLEKIRSKSVLLFVIIIVALLAFILGDFLTSGRTYFGHPTTVAKAGGVTVEYQDYQKRITELGEQLRNQGRDYSSDVITQNAIQSLLVEQLLKKEYSDLGIRVTDAELAKGMAGDTPHPAVAQTIGYLAQQLQLPEMSGRAVYDAMKNPAKYGLTPEIADQVREIWNAQQKDLEEALLNQKFMSLVMGLFTYNKLDAQSFYDDNATTKHVAYVNKDVATVSDDEIEFSEADVKALWESQKQMYRIDEETREVNYIYVTIEPSQADRIAGQQIVEEAIAGLNEQPGVEAVASNTSFVVNTINRPLSVITENRLRSFVEESEVGEAKIIERNNDNYRIGKLLDVKMGIDSINVSMLSAVEGVSLDSLVTILQGGDLFASHSDGVTINAQDSVWTSLEGVGVSESIKEALTNAAIGRPFVFTDSIQGQAISAIYKVNKRHNPVKYYDIAMIEYTVDPSQETLSQLASDLRTFVSNNSSAKEFTENATDAGYSILTDQVSVSSPGIGNARDSRRFVKWAMDAKKGQVSPMMQDDKQSYLIAVAVVDVYKNYLPYTSAAINTMLTSQARSLKKADKLLADYAGKAESLDGYAEVMGVEVAEGNVNITTPALLTVGVNESELQGAIAAAEPNKLVGPLKGTRGVMVFEVRDVNTDNRPFNEEEYGNRFTQTFGLGRRPTPLPLLLGKNKVDNRSLNFVASVGE